LKQRRITESLGWTLLAYYLNFYGLHERQNRHRLQVKFIGVVGAVFDFYTRRAKRSHPVFQKLGLEWLPSLLQEPRRLWRRMGISAPIFLWNVLKAGG
jgi:UDP-N-acetyl-D-mannosaminuronic acid transferase (WecB/TagA/CpsF family)